MAHFAGPCLVMLLFLWTLAGLGATGTTARFQRPAGSPPAQSTMLDAKRPVADVIDVANPAVRSYTIKDGLPQSSVPTMAFDQQGYLWVGTQDGAAFYNGRTWTTVNMPNRALSNKISSLVVAKDGSIWFGTEGNGVHRLARDGWTSYDTSSGLSHNLVTCMVEATTADGAPEVWVGTQAGLSRLSGGTWSVFKTENGLPNNTVRSLYVAGRETNAPVLWVGTNAGLARFDRTAGDRFAVDGRVPAVAVPCILSVRDGDDQKLWVGTEQGLHALTSAGVVTFNKTSGLPANDIRCLLETTDPAGERSLWVGTYGGGLVRYYQGSWRVFTSPATLPTNTVFSLAEFPGARKTTALWVGLNGGGLVRLDFNSWKSLDVRHGLPNNNVWCLLETIEDDGRTYWFGTNDGLARLEGGTWTIFKTSSGLPDNMVISLAQSRSERGTRILWAGTNNGLARFENGQWTTIDTKSGLPHNAVWSILPTQAEDGSPALWVGTKDGLARFANGAWKRFTTADGLPSNLIVSLLETEGRDGTRTLWVGTRGGLGKYSHGVWESQDTTAGLPNNSISDLVLFKDKDGKRILWAATGGGVARRDLDDPDPTWHPVPVELPTGMVSKIRADALGRLYVCTFKGIVRLTPQAQATAGDGNEFDSYTFTTEDGLPGDGVNQGGAMVDGYGRIWVGTVFGVGFFDPAIEVRDAEPKTLQMERILVNDRDLGSSDDASDPRLPVRLDENALTSLALSYNENSLEFEYALLSYYGESATRYRVQLEGFDPQPSAWTPEAKRTYTNLDAGTYTFKVWGMDFAGNISGPVTVGFSVAPAPWRTWWAYLLYLLVGGLVIFAGNRYHVRSLRRRNLALEAKVRERTRELSEQAEQLRLSEAKAHETEERALELADAALRASEEAIAAREAALRASRAKSVFLSNMSHELRTPLNAILGYTQLLARDETRDAEEQEDLAIVARSGEHLLSLINDVLSIAKIESGKLALNAHPFDLRRVLQAVEPMIRLRAEGKGIDLAFTIDETVPTMVFGDEGRLRQVLINLLGNAVKFTEEGHVELRARWGGGRAWFEIEDTGVGIDPGELRQLFQPFVQTSTGEKKQDGTGLGLVISQQIVQLMGGDIRVESRVGEGATFTFDIDLPLSEEPGTGVAERRVIGIAQGQRTFRILVAEDIAVNRRLLVKFLTLVGFEVREAQNGVEAVEVWETWRPDLIWMDLRMPVMDGHEAAARIRVREAELRAGRDSAACPPSCTIIGLTASAFEHERAAMVESGCDDVLIKPFREQDIFEKIATYLKVRFVYESVEPGADAEAEAAPFDTIERISRLPQSLLDELDDEVKLGSVRGIKRILEQASEYDQELAFELATLAKNFAFASIEETIQQARQLASVGPPSADPGVDSDTAPLETSAPGKGDGGS